MKNKAQVFIESTLAMAALLFLAFFIFRIFVWFNLSLAGRQAAYAGTQNTTNADFYNITQDKKLDVFDEGQ